MFSNLSHHIVGGIVVRVPVTLRCAGVMPTGKRLLASDTNSVCLLKRLAIPSETYLHQTAVIRPHHFVNIT
jgi:hypothetical protein